jgi:hypothetical protein
MSETVNGTIIGEIVSCGRLFYEGRPQGRGLYADDGAELRAEAQRLLEEIKADCGELYAEIYPRPDAWELRVY